MHRNLSRNEIEKERERGSKGHFQLNDEFLLLHDSQPGRVVTLIPTEEEDCRVYGIAYKIANHQRREVIEHLDFREKNGYERHIVQFHADPNGNIGADSTPHTRNIIIYVATKENTSYAGHKNDMNDIASQIFEAHGPSGSNCEYVYRLADAMRQQFPQQHDEHLFGLEKLLKEKERCSFSG